MGPVSEKGLSVGALLVRRSGYLLNGSQGPFISLGGQRGRGHRRWGFMLVNIDSTGFLQSPNTLAPLSSPLSVPHFPGGLWSGLPNVSWVTSEGSQQAWVEALKALASFFPPPSPGLVNLLLPASHPPACFGSNEVVFPLYPVQMEREAGPSLAMPAGIDALTLCV